MNEWNKWVGYKMRSIKLGDKLIVICYAIFNGGDNYA